MIARRAGKIVNIATDAARVGQEREVTYSAAKGGVISFTKSIAREVGRHNINVNAVSPAPPIRRCVVACWSSLPRRSARTAYASARRKSGAPTRCAASARPTMSARPCCFWLPTRPGTSPAQVLSVNGGFAMP